MQRPNRAAEVQAEVEHGPCILRCVPRAAALLAQTALAATKGLA